MIMTDLSKPQSPFNNRLVDYLTITDAAADEILARIDKRAKTHKDTVCYGIKIGIKTKGCSGLSYNLEYALDNNISEYDELVKHDKVNVFIDPKISLFIFNTIMDFKVKTSDTNTVIESGFIFTNPNEKGRCGCGESFYV